MPTERDPRKDPRPGDIVSQGRIFNGKRASKRVVVLRAPDNLTYESSSGLNRTCKLDTWKEWARGAEIVTRGEP